MPDRRDAADAETGERVRLSCRGPPQGGLPEHQRQPRRIDAIHAAYEDEEGLQAVIPVGHPDERLDDLSEVGPDRGRRFFRGGCLALEGNDVESDSLALCSLKDAPVGGVEGHGPECTIAAKPNVGEN